MPAHALGGARIFLSGVRVRARLPLSRFTRQNAKVKLCETMRGWKNGSKQMQTME